jgi:cytochrome c oxidase cbb3-type subunit 1
MELGQIEKNRLLIDSSVAPLVKKWVIAGVLWSILSLVLFGASMLELLNPERFQWSGLGFGKLFPLAKFLLLNGSAGCVAFAISVWVAARQSEDAPSVGILARWSGDLGFACWNVGLVAATGYVCWVGLPLTGIVPQGSLVMLSVGSALVCASTLAFGGVSVGSTRGFVLTAVSTLLAICSLVGFLRGSAVFALATALVLFSVIAFSGGGFSGPMLFVGTGLVGVTLSSFIRLTMVSGPAGIVGTVSEVWFSGILSSSVGLLIPMGAACFVLRKSSGNPVLTTHQSMLVAVLLGVFGGLVGLSGLADGPVPSWVGAVGSGSVFFVAVAVVTFASGVFGGNSAPAGSPSVTFVKWGAIVWLSGSLLRILVVLPGVAESAQLTLAQFGVDLLQYLLGGGLVAWGCVYYLFPRVCGCEWLSSSLISWHLRGALYGGGVAFLCLLVSGVASGSTLNEALAPFSESVAMGKSYYWGVVMGVVLMIFGFLSAFLNAGFLAIRIGQPAGEATLLPDASNH